MRYEYNYDPYHYRDAGADRWFCKLGLEDKVPDRTTFSKNRYGRFAEGNLFRELFYAVVRQAEAHGLVKGRHLTVDATTVEANASLDSMEENVVPFTAEEYLTHVAKENPVNVANTEGKEVTERLSNQTHRSRTDPDARLLSKPYQKTRLAYSDNVLMDNASRIILDVEVTEPNLHQEGQVAGDMLERSSFVTGLRPETMAGDKAYGYGAAVRRIVQNIKRIVKAIDRSQNGIPAIVERSAYLSRHIYEFLSKQMTAFINIFMQVPSFIFRKEFTATICP